MTTTRKYVFDEDAELYDKARPGYPEQLFEDLVHVGRLHLRSDVLEVGCGTGQATRSLAEHGYNITCVELGTSLAAVAARRLAHFPNVQVVNSAFEQWHAEANSFDLIFAATSWHWLDPDVSFPKAVRLLRPDGFLAIVTTHHVLPPDGDTFFAEIQEVYDSLGQGGAHLLNPDRFDDKTEHIEASGKFNVVKSLRYVWNQSYTAEEYIDVLNTYSDHRAMAAETRSTLYAEIRKRIAAQENKRVTKHYLNILHVARQIASGASSA